MTESAVAALPDSRVDHVSTKTRRTMLGVALALYVTGTIGSNVAFGWLDTRPELVLALSSRNRNLLGSVPFINPLAYAVIGFSRVMLVDGTAGYVSNDELRPIAEAPPTKSQRDAAGRLSSGPIKHSNVAPTPDEPLFDVNDVPLPSAESSSPKPAAQE